MCTVCLLRRSKRHMATLAALERSFKPSQLLVRLEKLTMLVTLLRGSDEDFLAFHDICGI